MIKKIVIIILCFAATGAYAQDGTDSPYSFFGVGELESVRTAENRMMGGIAMYADSIHVNLNNPAAYGHLGVKAGDDFGMTVYAASISYEDVSLNSATGKESTSVANLDYLSIAMALKEGLGIGFGLTPYSSVGYTIVSESTNASDATVINAFDGSGGLSRVYFSAGYKIRKDLSVGATFNYNFGTIENNRLQTVEGVQFGTRDDRTSRISGADFNYSLNYTPKLNDKYTLFTSVRVDTQGNLSSRNAQRTGSISTITGRDIEVADIDLVASGLRNTDLKIPTATTLGLGFGEDTKWFIGAEYTYQDWSSFTNEFVVFDNLVYEDANSFALGGFYIPNHDSFSSYFKRVTYRAGIRFEDTGLVINNTAIDDFGITFGVGLPLTGSFSNLNLGFEFGQKGTTDADLIEENYFTLSLGLSLNDLWFRKRKIN